MDPTLQKVYDTIMDEHMITENDSVLVGFSGGADSLFLMIALIEIKKYIKFEIYAAHLNHGIRGEEADKDESFVANFCHKNDITLFSKNVNIPNIAKQQKISDEIAGRNERYNFFEEICKSKSINKIAVAHNKNDSVETVVLNMIRGASLNGLCGIKPVNGNIIRPIINLSRDDIEKYLDSRHESFCTDSTNLTNIYTRNKIRNDILKTMSEINPSVIDTIYSNLTNLNNDNDFLESYCNNLECIKKCKDEVIITRSVFDKQHTAIKNRLILKAFELLKGNCINISAKHLDIISNASSVGKTYNMPGNIKVIISYNKIIFIFNEFGNGSFEHEIHPGETLELNTETYLSAEYCNDPDFSQKDTIFIDADKIKSKKLVIRSRKDGDKFVPYGMNKPKKIKEYFIDIKIPVYKRAEIPILVVGSEIAAVIPYRVSEFYKVNEETKNILKLRITKEK